MMMKIRIAVAWLSKDDWPLWQEMDSDLPAYDQWLKKIHGDLREARVRGVDCEQIILHPAQFVAWCRAKGRTTDSDARAAYASAILAKRTNP